MNTLAKEIFKPKLFSDQHERFEKEYPGFHQMIYDSMEEYAKAYAPVPELSYPDKLFERYVVDARNEFVEIIIKHFPHIEAEHGRITEEGIELRTACEDILIAYDQMKEKLAAPVPDSKTEEYYNNLTKKLGTYTDYQYTGPRCVAGCKRYTGYETYHHKDCPYYPNSFSERFDKLVAAPVPGKEEMILAAQQEYIEFLSKAYNDAFSLAHVHGFSASQKDIDKGIELRNKIKTITDAASPSTASNEDKGEEINKTI